MVTISLCIIVKNEANTIARCLESVQHLVDEIVIVDTGSTDETKQVCRRFTDDIYDFAWVDDFSAARNYAFAQATKDFIFWLDADDVVSEADQRKFQDLKKTLTLDVDAVSMKYELSFTDEGDPRHTLRRHRIVRRTAGFRWIGAVHEYLEVSGTIQHSDVAIQHRQLSRDPDRNIKIYEKLLARGETFTPRDMYYYGNELKDHARYEEAIKYYDKFLQTDDGWLEDVIGACNKLSDCYKRMENERMELQSALRALEFDYPRAESCCRIGEVFFRRGDYATSTFWYTAALASVNVKPDKVPMFENPAYSTWIPHLQLCVCYYRMGSHYVAYLHNEQAGQYIPNDERISRNRTYLEPLAQKQKEALQEKMEAQFPQTISGDGSLPEAVDAGDGRSEQGKGDDSERLMEAHSADGEGLDRANISTPVETDADAGAKPSPLKRKRPRRRKGRRQR